MAIAAIYTRQSLDKTGKEAGVKRQLEECRELADGLDGVTVSYELSDNDISATTGKTRPDFEKLLKLIEAGTVDTVITWHTDRLYRKLRDLVRITDIAEKHPVTIRTVKAGELDLNSATGRMLAGILGSVSSQEGEHRTDRQKLAYGTYAQQGTWHWSNRPYGYDRPPGRFQKTYVVPTEAAILRDLFARYADGESRHSLVRWLNENKILSTTGKQWSITALRSMLNNPHYAGINSYRGQLIDAHDWEPILTREEWERYTGAASRRKVVSSFSREATSLLSGIIVCAVCEGKVYHRPRGTGRAGGYNCVNNHVSITPQQAEPKVRDAVVSALVLGPQNLVPTNDNGQSIESIGEAVSRLQSLADDITDDRAAGLITTAKARPQLVDIKAQLDELAAQRDAIIASSAAAEILAGIRTNLFAGARVSIQDAADASTQIGERFDAMTLRKRRELVELLVSVRLHPGRGTERLKVKQLRVTSLNEDAGDA